MPGAMCVMQMLAMPAAQCIVHLLKKLCRAKGRRTAQPPVQQTSWLPHLYAAGPGPIADVPAALFSCSQPRYSFSCKQGQEAGYTLVVV